MINIQPVTEDLFWIGGSDRRLALFENLFPLPNGMSYNSYILKDEKTVLFDTADAAVDDQFMENLKTCAGENGLDYVIVLHMEPDHCALLESVLTAFPGAKLVSSAKALQLIGQFFPTLKEKAADAMVIKEGDTLCTGKHTLRFVAAPMVHWPEVMMAYDEVSGTLFSADAFGTFGAIDSRIVRDAEAFCGEFLSEARRYYTNIVGKYGPQVQAVLKKAGGLSVSRICSLHGPVWEGDLSGIIGKYDKWSSYTPEDPDDTVVVYGSMYGHTASAADAAAALIAKKTGARVAVYDVSKTDLSTLIAEIFRCGRLVIFSPTYNNGIYVPIETLLHDMAALGVRDRKVAVAQNGSWAPSAGAKIMEKLSAMKNMTVSEDMLTITSSLHAEDMPALESFAEAFAAL